MDFKKCVRCGSFFISDNDVCCNCSSKDNKDIATLNNFISGYEEMPSVAEISSHTGIMSSNINRYIKDKSIKGLKG